MRRPSLSYANVTATLALILALAGTSYAAVTIDGADIQRKSIPLNRLKGKLPKGPVGPQGVAGAAGAQGAVGLAGATGSAGAVGPAGIRGPKGDEGVVGPQGAIGPQGATGSQGSAGPQGATGAQGSQGLTGAQGGQGPQGLKGDTGDQGSQGVQGPPGLVSDTVFQAAGATDQSSGQDHALVTATGLAAGSYLVTFRTELSPVQAYTCGIASGSLLGPSPIVTRRHGGTDPETFESTGVLTILQTGEQQILYCNGATDDWDAGAVELHFLEIDQLIDGVEE
jgi:hypothetical protein